MLTSVLRTILNEKRRLDQEKKDTLSKLLRLEVQSRALEERAEKAFSREVEVLEDEERQAAIALGFPTLGGDPPSSSGVVDTTGFPPWSDADWAALELDPALLADPGSVGGTAPSAQGSSGSREVPTS